MCVCVQEVLVDQRTALSDLLQQLLKQKNQREQELQQILVRELLPPSGPKLQCWQWYFQRSNFVQ